MKKESVLLKILKIQRLAFVRRVDGSRLITNHLLYQQCEDELLRLQELIGQENKRNIKKECDERGVTYPDFRSEGIKSDLRNY